MFAFWFFFFSLQFILMDRHIFNLLFERLRGMPREWQRDGLQRYYAHLRRGKYIITLSI